MIDLFRRFARVICPLVLIVLALLAPIAARASALSITAANVSLQSGPTMTDQAAGEAFIAGAIVYQAANGTWLKAQCDGTVIEAGSNKIGMALATADAAGARITVATAGAIVSIGAGAAGSIYVVGTTAGTLIPVADLASTNKVTPAALGIGTNKVLLLWAYNAGAVVP